MVGFYPYAGLYTYEYIQELDYLDAIVEARCFVGNVSYSETGLCTGQDLCNYNVVFDVLLNASFVMVDWNVTEIFYGVHQSEIQILAEGDLRQWIDCYYHYSGNISEVDDVVLKDKPATRYFMRMVVFYAAPLVIVSYMVLIYCCSKHCSLSCDDMCISN